MNASSSEIEEASPASPRAGDAGAALHYAACDPPPRPSAAPLGVHALLPLVAVALAIAAEPALSAAPRLLARWSAAAARRLLWLSLRASGWALLAGLVLGSLFLAYKLARLLVFVATYADPGAAIEHHCVPADDSWDHRPLLLQPTLDVLHSLGAAERLAPLARSGALLVVRPGDWVEALSCGRVPEGFPPEATAMYEQLTRRRPAQRHGEEGGGAEEEEQQQQPAAADAAANAAAAAAATWALSSGDVAACVRAGAHGTVFVLGTSHLSKKSADEVEEAVRLIRPDLVFLELDAARQQLMYRDEEDDSAPPPTTMQLLSEVASAMGRPDRQDLLQVLMSTMYRSFEAQLGGKAGLEFTAARKAAERLAQAAGARWERQLEAMLGTLPGGGAQLRSEREQMRPPRQGSGGEEGEAGGCGEPSGDAGAPENGATGDGMAAGGDGAGAGGEAGAGDSGQGGDGDCGADGGGCGDAAARETLRDAVGSVRIMLGDRPVKDTLRALWAALTPRQRLKLCWDLLQGMFEKLDEGTVEAMKDDDLISLLLQDLGDACPGAMRPLFHDRNWVLGTGLWCAAATAAQMRASEIHGRAHEAQHWALHELKAAGELSDYGAAVRAAQLAVRAAAAGGSVSADGGCGGCGGWGGCARCGGAVVGVVGKGHVKGIALAMALLAAATAASAAGADGAQGAASAGSGPGAGDGRGDGSEEEGGEWQEAN